MNSARQIRITFWLCLFFITIPVTAQEQNDLQQSELRLKELFTNISLLHSDVERRTLADSLAKLFHTTLQLPGSFNYPFDLLTSMGKVKSDDQKLRIYTWNIPDKSGTHTFYGFLQYKSAKNSDISLWRLTDLRSLITEPSAATLGTDNWYGCLIYGIVKKDFEGIPGYTLLGFTPENLFTSRKIIDILWFKDPMEPVFGKAVFRCHDRLQSRILFQYSAKVSMSLQWNEKINMIIFDHLSPSKPSYAGNYQYYGPDFSYDGLKFEQGIWELVENVDIRNQ
jgi:hypothetical protein